MHVNINLIVISHVTREPPLCILFLMSTFYHRLSPALPGKFSLSSDFSSTFLQLSVARMLLMNSIFFLNSILSFDCALFLDNASLISFPFAD